MQFVNEIKQGNISPLYFFYGEENFLIERALNNCLDLLVDPTTADFNFDVFYGAEAAVGDVLSAAVALPMMAARRVVVIKEIEKLSFDENTRKAFLGYIERSSTETVLICTGNKVDIRKQPFKSLKNNASAFEFKPLYDNQIPEWVITYVKTKQKTITTDAVRLLQVSVGNSLLVLSKEIDKLLSYIRERQMITDEDVEQVVGISRAFNIFELSNAVGGRHLKKAVQICRSMLERGESPIGMIVMLVRHFNILWKLYELCTVNNVLNRSFSNEQKKQFSQQVSINPYFFDEYVSQLVSFPYERFEKIFRTLLDADKSLKMSYQKPDIVLELAIYNIVK